MPACSVSRPTFRIGKISSQRLTHVCESPFWDQAIEKIRKSPARYGARRSAKAERNRADIDNMLENDDETKKYVITVHCLQSEELQAIDGFLKAIPEPTSIKNTGSQRLLFIDSHPLSECRPGLKLIKHKLDELGTHPVIKVSIGFPEESKWWKRHGFRIDPKGKDENDLILAPAEGSEIWRNASDSKPDWREATDGRRSHDDPGPA